MQELIAQEMWWSEAKGLAKPMLNKWADYTQLGQVDLWIQFGGDVEVAINLLAIQSDLL